MIKVAAQLDKLMSTYEQENTQCNGPCQFVISNCQITSHVLSCLVLSRLTVVFIIIITIIIIPALLCHLCHIEGYWTDDNNKVEYIEEMKKKETIKDNEEKKQITTWYVARSNPRPYPLQPLHSLGTLSFIICQTTSRCYQTPRRHCQISSQSLIEQF